jgi:hypothetical protein
VKIGREEVDDEERTEDIDVVSGEWNSKERKAGKTEDTGR